MQHLADLLAPLPLPAANGAAAALPAEPALVHDLGAGLPAGHLHVWGGPTGAGKTSFLLALLHGAAAQGRRVVYASYDLPVETLALRLLAMLAGVDGHALARGTLSPEQASRAAGVRVALAAAPFQLLPARGFSAVSLEDRLVRMPFRAEVLAVDFLQAVVREPNTDPGRTLRDLAALASRLHVAVVCAVKSEGAAEATSDLATLGVEAADRLGWIVPAGGPGRAPRGGAPQPLRRPHRAPAHARPVVGGTSRDVARGPVGVRGRWACACLGRGRGRLARTCHGLRSSGPSARVVEVARDAR